MSKALSDKAWLTIVGLGEDGLEGLAPASRKALEAAEVVMGPSRHLGLLPALDADIHEWPVPFADGLAMLKGFAGRRVVVLVSGDPLWFGAGSVIAREFAPEVWRALPGPSTFSLAAARLGWPLETTRCLGLHAAPMSRLRPFLAPGTRAIVLLRDGDAVDELAAYLTEHGFGESALTVFEALGGPRETRTETQAMAPKVGEFSHPVAVAVDVAGQGPSLPRTAGIDDAFFDHDGQITKRPMRALALSALAPRPNEMLWDIGGGAGSIGIEWLLADPSTQAVSVEVDPDRAQRIRQNTERLGADRLRVIEGLAPEVLADLPPPAAVFIGGGLSEALLSDLNDRLRQGTRLVAHAATLESETLLATWSARLGGSLLRVEMSEASPLGSKRGWKAAYPVVQWQVVL